MRTLTDTFSGFATHPTLYRIWIPLHNNGRAPLVSIWIDPALRGSQSCARAETTANFWKDRKRFYRSI
jgi:hypothetical protein